MNETQERPSDTWNADTLRHFLCRLRSQLISRTKCMGSMLSWIKTYVVITSFFEHMDNGSGTGLSMDGILTPFIYISHLRPTSWPFQPKIVQLLQRIRNQFCDHGEEAGRYGVTKAGQEHVLDGQRNRHPILHRLLYFEQDEFNMRKEQKETKERHCSRRHLLVQGAGAE